MHPCTGLYILHITGQANRNGSVGDIASYNKYILTLVFALSPIFDSHLYTEGRPVVRGVKLATMHPLRTWMHPLGIRKISKNKLLISALKTVRHPTAPTSCTVELPKLGTAQYARCLVQCWRVHYVIKVLILCYWQRRFLPLCVRNIYTFYIYNRVLWTCTGLCMLARSGKPLHPSCSWSGYGPDWRLSSVRLEILLSVCIQNKHIKTRTPLFGTKICIT